MCNRDNIDNSENFGLNKWDKGRVAQFLHGVAAGVILFIISGPDIAAAQEAAATGSAASGKAEIGDIVVTANRYETNVQKTPLAVDVVGKDELQVNGVKSVTDLSFIAPAVNMTGTGAFTLVTIRGISSRTATNATGDPAVALSSDGFYQDRTYAIDLTQYDLDRIEVVKGPQGTLAGRNATGGAVNLITTKPGRTFGGYAMVDVGNFDALSTEGAINMPLADKLQARASFASAYHKGYRDFGPIAGRNDDQDTRSGRFQLQFEPTDNLTLHALVQKTTANTAGPGARGAPFRVDANGYLIRTPVPYGNLDVYDAPVPTALRLNDSMFRWDAEFKTPLVNVTYLGGYDDLKFYYQVDASIFTAPAGFNPVRRAANVIINENPHTTNHEIRFKSPDPESPFTYQFGVFYFNNTNNTTFAYKFYPSGTFLTGNAYEIKFRSIAEFGQIAYKPVDGLKFTFGMRHNNDRKTQNGFAYSGGAVLSNPRAVSNIYSANRNTYHGSVDYQVDPDHMLYAKVDTGYKAGGFNSGGPNYGPESNIAYEIGSKNRFFDNKLQFNIDGYYIKYSGQQLVQYTTVNEQSVGTTLSRIVNAGKTRIWGVEANGIAVLPFGKIEANLNYVNARYTTFVITNTDTRYLNGAFVEIAPGQNVDLAGNRPPNAPLWTFGGSFEHVFPVVGGNLTARIQTKYTGQQYFTSFNRGNEAQDAYFNTAVMLTYAPRDTFWEVQAYVKNLENNYVFAVNNEQGSTASSIGGLFPPRTYGVRLRARF